MNDTVKQYFEGRTLVIATMHGKEKIIGPLLRDELGVTVIIPEDMNTDIFGTFSGEIERSKDPLTTARQKCMKAAELTGCDLALASEGSFGPHPSMFFIPADDEVLVLIDLKNNSEIKARKISTNTNFAGGTFTDWQSAKTFAEAAQFPSHGIIIRKNQTSHDSIVKGICTWEQLQDTFKLFIEKQGSAYLETDMRAMYNPTRQGVIKEATERLLKTIKNTCPDCHTPGYDIVNVVAGLPCSLCSFPTSSTLYFEYACAKCTYRSVVNYPNGKQHEDPMYCDNCNP